MEEKSIAASALNNMHVSWIYVEPESREKYYLEQDVAYYHTGSNPSEVKRIVGELLKLNIECGKDYYVNDTFFDNEHIFTICLKEETAQSLEKLGVELVTKIS